MLFLVNHGDLEGAAPDLLVWSAGALPQRRKLVHAVRNRAMLPGPAVIRTSDWLGLPPAVIAAEDVGAWPYSAGLLIMCVAFLSTVRWRAAVGGFPLLSCFSCMTCGLVRGCPGESSSVVS